MRRFAWACHTLFLFREQTMFTIYSIVACTSLFPPHRKITQSSIIRMCLFAYMLNRFDLSCSSSSFVVVVAAAFILAYREHTRIRMLNVCLCHSRPSSIRPVQSFLFLLFSPLFVIYSICYTNMNLRFSCIEDQMLNSSHFFSICLSNKHILEIEKRRRRRNEPSH